MDMTAQIKENLISRIRDSKDMIFLKALQTILDSSEQALYELNLEQQPSISKSRNQIKDGKFHKNEDVISEMKEWLKKK
ncbi:hypothetical protein [Flavobacterium sp. 1355]|jgi:hypothetical protein|uniref:hypothetical protein n=1 Tax=Flavobacterium sp. 1355 TaxID=2806571 RepID=UPI001AE897BD|nr:hypothetical protein [Flavobacterium sp. 1355]MBP1223493.1 hypothetical protein [Flavobacterium sp. 1355]